MFKLTLPHYQCGHEGDGGKLIGKNKARQVRRALLISKFDIHAQQNVSLQPKTPAG
jgi:hypothetical protein